MRVQRDGWRTVTTSILHVYSEHAIMAKPDFIQPKYST